MEVQRSLVADVREALMEGRPGARRRALSLAASPGIPPRTRLALALSAGFRRRPGKSLPRDERVPRQSAPGLRSDGPSLRHPRDWNRDTD
jgi:hypothetical protein